MHVARLKVDYGSSHKCLQVAISAYLIDDNGWVMS
jgi:hypothetical protein